MDELDSEEKSQEEMDDEFDTEFEQFTKNKEEMMRDLTASEAIMEKKFGRFTESLKNIPSASDKKSFLQSMKPCPRHMREE